jgi:hypothetical protein
VQSNYCNRRPVKRRRPLFIHTGYDDPNLVDSTAANFLTSDLHEFDLQFGLPDPPSFLKLNENGLASPLPAASGSTGWSLEECLDVEWAHAIAPQANIILFEANSTSDADLISTAVNTARNYPGVSAVTMSFGRSEEGSADIALNSVFTTPVGHAGVTFLASTGDDGSPGLFPAYSPNVVAVGGTTLTLSGNNYVSETGWSDGGGGQSSYQSEPTYQLGVQTSTMRQIPDVSFDADPASGVAVYDSYDEGSSDPWVQVGGTSVSSPCWAGLVAIGDQFRTSVGLGTMDGPTQTLPLLYAMKAGDFHDITSGSNGGFSAHAGYDEVTGIGTPVANNLLPDFVPVSSIGTVVFSASSYEIGTSATITVGDLDLLSDPSCPVTLTSSAGDTETLNLAAQGGGIFTGSILTSAATVVPGDGILETVPGGTITVTYHDIGDGQTVTATATTYSVGHYTFTTIGSPQTAGVPFSVTATAYDTFNNPIPGYTGTVSLTGSGQGGALSISPATVTFASGAWTGSVTVNAVDPTVQLRLNNGVGANSTSNVFATQAGAVASFQWGTIPAPVSQNVAFPVTLTAKDANGYTVAGFNGSTTLTGWVNGGSSVVPAPGTPSASGNIQLLGTNVQLGVNADGSLIDQNLSLGAKFLGDEFLVPGTPLASFALAANGNVYYNSAACGESSNPIAMTVQNVSTGSVLHAQATGSTGGINVTRDIWFQPSSDAVSFQVKLQNTTATAMNNVAWMEEYDPDQGYALNGSYATNNNVLFGGQYVEAVYYYTPTYPNGLTIAMGSNDPRTVASAQGFGVVNPFTIIDDPVNPNGALADICSELAFNVGTLAAGASTTLTYYMVFASDRSVAANLYQAQLRTPVPVIPTTVTFTSGVATCNMTVQQTATNMYLQADDGNGQTGTSSTFNVLALPPLTVSVPANTTEGNPVANGTISIPTALSSNLVVNLASSDTNRLTVPASATILAGQTSVSVPVTTINTGLLDGPEAVVVTATASGYLAGTGTVEVHDDMTATLSMSLPPAAHEDGGSVIGTITSSAAPSQNITVALTSSGTTHLTVPATITLPAGQTSVNFTATLLDDHVIGPPSMPVTVTAQVENWTSGVAMINILEDDATMAISLPVSGWEGRTLSGTVQIGGTLSTPLVVFLASNNTTQLTVPATVTIPAGLTSATFTAMLLDNGLRTGPQTVQVTATASGLPTATANVIVDDADVDHYTWTTIGGPETAGVPFTVTATACDILNNPILVYDGAATLSATGQAGALSISPTTVTFVNGTWTGNVTVNAVDPTVTLMLNDGNGHTGTSTVFATQPGPVASFQWSTISSPQYATVPFSTTITAEDAHGYTATGFNGSAALSGAVGSLTTGMVLGEPTPTTYYNTGTWSLGYSFTPSSTMTVTDVLHYFGTKISIWTIGGTLVAAQTFPYSGPGWLDTPLATPVQLTGGQTYIVDDYTAGENYYLWPSTSHTSPLGTLGQAYYVSGDGFPSLVDSTSVEWWTIDLKAQVGSFTSEPVSPATATFVSGTWTGNVTVATAANGMHLNVVDGSYTGTSNTFDMLPPPWLSLSLPTGATEGDGTVTGWLDIPFALTSNLTVSLASSDPTRLTVPATETIPAGQTLISLPITIIDTGLLNGPEAVTITVSASGYTSGAGTMTVHDDESASLSVSLPSSVPETGSPVTGTVTSSAAPTQNITLQLTSSGPTHLTVPATVTLPAGQTTVSFTATPVDDHVISALPIPVTVTASMENWVSGTGTIAILDNDRTLTLTLPASGWEGQTETGTVTMGGTLPTSTVISLASGNTSELTLPTSVTVPAGSLSTTFTATLIDNGLRTGPVPVQVTANSTGFPPGVATTVVDDADVDHYTFSGLPTAIPAGTSFTLTARAYDILNNPITVYNATVPLSATGLGGTLVVSPTSMTFASGLWTGSVTVSTADPAAVLKLNNGQGITSVSSPIDVYAPLQVGSTSPPVGGVLTLPVPATPVTLNVNFNDPITPSSISTSTLALSGIAGATVSAVSVLAGNTTASFTISGITTNGTLTASIAAGAVHDQYGYPNLAFSGSYITHIQTQAFPVPLTSVAPAGSLVYEGTVSAVLNPAGVTDTYTLAVDPRQTVSVLVTPTSSGLQPSVRLIDPTGAVIGTGTAAAAGQDALIQATATTGTMTGTYQIVIGGAGSTLGNCTVQVTLNAALDAAAYLVGVSNGTLGTAQPLDGSFLSLAPATNATRAAVLGANAAMATPWDNYYSVNLSAGDVITAGLKNLSGSGAAISLLNPAGVDLANGATGSTNLDQVISGFTIPAAGTYYLLVTGEAAATYGVVVTRNAAFDTHPNSSFATAQSISGTSGVVGYVSSFVGGGTATLTAVNTGWWDGTGAHTSGNTNYIAGYDVGDGAEIRDYFVFNLASVSQNIASAQLSLYNPSSGYDSTVSTETYTSFDVSTPIATLEASGSGQTAIFNDLGSGTSLAATTVSAANDNADVLVNMNSAGVSYLNAARGSQVAVGGAVTPIVGTSQQTIFAYTGTTSLNTLILTYATASTGDWYSINVPTAGSSLSLTTSTPSDGSGEFENTLSPHIQLYDPSGNLVASGTVGGDGRNETINYTAAVTGAYRIQVSAKSSTQGEYVLAVQQFAPPSTTSVTVTPADANVPPALSATVSGAGAGAAIAAAEYFVDTVGANGSGIALSGTFPGPTVNVSGTLTTALFNGLAQGTHTIYVHGENVAGYWGPMVSVTFVKDTVAPIVSVNPLSTSNTTPTLTGSVNDPTATIQVTVAGQTYSATNNGDGTWTLPGSELVSPLGEGIYDVQVAATDPAGNVGSDDATGDLLIDTTSPTSYVNALPERENSLTFTVSVTGSDPVVGGVDSGVVSYDVYETDNGGAWTLWQTLPASDPSATFTGQSSHAYGFCSIAHDAAGNVEAKPLAVEGGTYVPDLVPPVTAVTSVDSTTATFQVNFQGTDAGASGLAIFQIFVSVDGAAAQSIGTVAAGTPTGGVYTGSLTHQAISDGASHTYRFYSIGVNGTGDVEAVPAGGSQVAVTATFATPSQLAATGFSVENGLVERSFVRYIDVTFNESAGLSALVAGINDANPNSSSIRLLRFGLDGSGPGIDVPLTGKVTAVGQVLAFDFGAGGIGGDANSSLGDGYYELDFDLNNNGTFDTVRHFYRLLGDVNGDHVVNAADIAAIAAALGQSGPLTNQDVNGDGIVDNYDRQLAVQNLYQQLGSGLSLDD